MKLADLGCGRMLGTRYASTAAGTHAYMAPEVIMYMMGAKIHYDARADLWSLGLVYCDITMGTLPDRAGKLPPPLPATVKP